MATKQKTSMAQDISDNSQHQARLSINLPCPPKNLCGTIEVIDQLQQQLAQPQSSRHLLVSNLSGVGKSTICRQIAHQCADNTNDIIWIDCENDIVAQLRAHVAPPLNFNTQFDGWLFELVELLNSRPGPNVLFLDKLNNHHCASEVFTQLKRLKWHIVASSKEHLGAFDQQHRVDVLSTASCIELFQCHYQLSVSREDTLTSIIAASDHRPLTIELIAKIANKMMMPLTNLLTHIKNHGSKPDKWFSLANMSQDEQQILRLIAVLPHRYYHAQNELSPWLDLDNPRILMSLASSGWLQQQDWSFALHPVIADMIQQQCKLDNSALLNLCNNLKASIEPADNQQWNLNGHYLSQLNCLIDKLEHSKFDKSLRQTANITIAHLLEMKANIVKINTDNHQATELLQQTIKLRINTLEMSDKKEQSNFEFNLTASLNNLALILDNQSSYPQQLTLEQPQPDTENASPVQDNHANAVTLDNIGQIYYQQKQFDLALEHFEQALALKKQQLPQQHPSINTSLNNLALVYKSKGDISAAIKYYQQSLDIKQQTLSLTHPDLAVSFNNLAICYHKQGEHAKALPLLLRAQKIWQLNSKPQCPNIQRVKHDLAFLIKQMGGEEEDATILAEIEAQLEQEFTEVEASAITAIEN